MTRSPRNEALRKEAIRLRLEERLSLRAISDATGAAKGSLSVWLKDYPLTPEEVRERQAIVRYVAPKKDRGEVSKFWSAQIKDLTRAEKGKIAETAVLFRLYLNKFDVYSSPFGGDKTDWMVWIPETRKAVRIEVRWARCSRRGGLPYFSLMCRAGVGKYRRYSLGEFDFIVGYDIYSDTVYVFSHDEVLHLTAAVTVRPEAAERWDKLRV